MINLSKSVSLKVLASSYSLHNNVHINRTSIFTTKLPTLASFFTICFLFFDKLEANLNIQIHFPNFQMRISKTFLHVIGHIESSELSFNFPAHKKKAQKFQKFWKVPHPMVLWKRHSRNLMKFIISSGLKQALSEDNILK